MLIKYRLINVEGVELLDTHAGRKRLQQIDDTLAAELHARGSRYVEKLPDPEPEPPQLKDTDVAQLSEPAAEPKPKRRRPSAA